MFLESSRTDSTKSVGDYQFDVYRMMKDVTGGTWEAFHPITNVMVGHLFHPPNYLRNI